MGYDGHGWELRSHVDYNKVMKQMCQTTFMKVKNKWKNKIIFVESKNFFKEK